MMPERLIVVWRRARRVAATMSTRQRRALAVALVLLTSMVGVVGSAAPSRTTPPPLEPVSQQVVAEIQAGRPAGYPVGGIDLSSHDHRLFGVHWRTEVAAGSQFVYVKATEGTTYVNPNFVADYSAARAVHRYVGAYVYARPDLGDPIGQAEHFLRHARFARDARTLVPFVDLEWPYRMGTDNCYNLNPKQLRAWIRAFINRIAAGIGRKPMIYTNTYWWNPCTGNDTSYGDHPLDIANYTKKQPRLPAGWTTFALWQYLPGNPTKSHSHDRVVVNGGPAGLRALAWPPPQGSR
jgi:GH25 family lysozyme M1 (1,4-beta-N-acetylmuramidase)